ncbi:hypothetical protein [uncultured Fusobacterium sp.]|uniref:hypothetical protein n=1 Tax=uncultured Fusobacterium sp. TaxID=159267 RepID=UPI0015A565F5|nr:hypothetical protein [uncultured Fusobacterium sp.]
MTVLPSKEEFKKILDKKLIKKKILMTNEEMFEYVIHTNELEGHTFKEEEKEIIKKVAEGKISSKETLEIFSKK